MASVMASQLFRQNLVTFCKFTGNEAGIDCSAPVEMNHEAGRAEPRDTRGATRGAGSGEKKDKKLAINAPFTGLFCPLLDTASASYIHKYIHSKVTAPLSAIFPNRSLRTKEKRIHRHLYWAMLIQVTRKKQDRPKRVETDHTSNVLTCRL